MGGLYNNMNELVKLFTKLKIDDGNSNELYFIPDVIEIGIYKIKKSRRRTPSPDSRKFGRYKCIKCGKYWISFNSWRESTQACSHCKSLVFSYERHNSEWVLCGPHKKDLCSKCLIYGDCRFINEEIEKNQSFDAIEDAKN